MRRSRYSSGKMSAHGGISTTVGVHNNFRRRPYGNTCGGGCTGTATSEEVMKEGTPAFFFDLTGVKDTNGCLTPDKEDYLDDTPGELISVVSRGNGNKIDNESGRQTQDRIMWIELGLCKALVRAVTHVGFLSPTPVQTQAIPAVLSGSDVCARAVTGSGKTAAFLLPLVHILLTRAPMRQTQMGGRRRFIRSIILVPTRELGMQCQHMLQQLLAFTTSVTVALAIGGVAQSAQEAAIESSPDIVIATPGRIVDLLYNYKGSNGSLDLSGVELVVLDECDKMLSVTLKEQVVDVLKRIPEETRQVLMFSATMTSEVDEFAKEHLFEPKNVDIGHVALQAKLRQQFVRIRLSTSTQLPVTQPDEDNDGNTCSGTQGMVLKKDCVRSKRSSDASNAEVTESHDVGDVAEHVTKTKSRYLVALCLGYSWGRTIVFTRYRTTAHRLHLLFSALGLKSAELQGNQLQSERVVSLQKFASGEMQYLFSTDVASRGLDIKGVSTVINFDLPPTLTAYIHRVGRTARIGGSGTALSIVDEARDTDIMRKILAVSGIVNSHQVSSVKRRDVPDELLLKATAKIEAVFPRVREQLAAEALETKIEQAERRYGHSGEEILAGSMGVRPKKAWCLSPAERKRRDEEARLLYEKEADVTVNHFQNELANWNSEEKQFLRKQKQLRRQQREVKTRVKERVKNAQRELLRKSEKKLQAGLVKKLKKKKIRDARRAKRAESCTKSVKPAHRHRDGSRNKKKFRR